MPVGYYRFPTIHDDEVVFICEDDLWTVSAKGGVARRLTSGLAEASFPVFSPDGSQIAFVGREEGQPEVYLMPSEGGPSQRLTYLGGTVCRTVGWSPQGEVVFANNAGQPFQRVLNLFALKLDGTGPERMKLGPAAAISFGENGDVVIGRHTGAPERWKRYKGGTAGQIWIDAEGDGEFRPLIELEGNLASPMWIGGRVFFLSDHEGVANIYSCLPDGAELSRHTDHEEYYARNATTDSKRIVYHAGADLFVYDPATDDASQIEISFHSPQTQRNRKFVAASRYLDSWKVHPKGHSVAITSRGKAFSFANWEGAVIQHGKAAGPRYRLLDWLNDGKRLVGVTDEDGEETFVILAADESEEPKLLETMDYGRPIDLAVNPKEDQILFSNHRQELCFLDLEKQELRVIDRGKVDRIAGYSWSPDGKWAAYGVSISLSITMLKLWNATSGEIHDLTTPVLWDYGPQFDPEGKFLYFFSHRHFDPVYDNIHFDLGFPNGVRPYLITLQAETPSPFVPVPRAPGEKPRDNQDEDDEKDKNDSGNDSTAKESNSNGPDNKESLNDAEEKKKEQPLVIDLDGIQNRIVAFPVMEGRYGRIMGIKGGRVIYTRYPVEGSLNQSWVPGVPPAKGQLYVYDLADQKEELLLSRVGGFDLSHDRATLIYRSGSKLRLLKAGAKPAKDAGSSPGRKSGWIDLNRVKVSVIPATEWGQMFREAWRLQRDQFWTENMSNVDWLGIYDRYLPLVERVASRSEFSDLIWEMQGELGTSHNYEVGGDYRAEPKYAQGFLGADLDFDEKAEAWRISRIIKGDAWDANYDSPLNEPGLNVSVGDHILAINGRKLDRDFSPATALVNLAGQEVVLTMRGEDDEENKTVTIKAMTEEFRARYRQWVEQNRRYVHEKTEGQIGYIHVPDMGPNGYAEFHRGYLAEVDRTGMIIDVRFNGGGHVSELLLEKLARKRIGYVATRWGSEPFPFPGESVLGPMVALTNEYAGSDGDIFSHGFKLLNLGPLVGTRTWGGVIGIYPRHLLADGTVTTQAEFSFWFEDVGWGVENYGTDPDIEIDNRPQDHRADIDVQLDRAIEEAMKMLAESPPQVPALDKRPNLALPKLPKRG